MNYVDYFVVAVILIIIGSALWYIRRTKKKGVKCIGCPDGAKCAERCAGCSGNCCGNGADSQ